MQHLRPNIKEIRHRQRDGERKERVEWSRVVIFNEALSSAAQADEADE